MKITRLDVENFRSIRELHLLLDDTTVFIGPNNAGKSAILEAVRIALSRRWGQQGTGFTEDDVHRPDEATDPRTAPSVRIGLVLDEPSAGAWSSDMVAELDSIMAMMPSGLNRISFYVVYSWNSEARTFVPGWEFLDSAGKVLPLRRRSINLSGFFNYLPFFFLGALRDAHDEFAVRSRHWGTLLRSIQIPAEVESEVKEALDGLDAKLLAADPRLTHISETIGQATEIAIGDTPGAAKLRMLPLNIWDLLSRAGVVLRNEGLRPWLPLDHHGQGLQSLSVVFLVQAAVAHRLSQELEGTEPVFAIEEPEAHLHPQAARTLWARIRQLPGQKLVTTHSPFFVQNVPLHNLRIVRFNQGSTEVAWLDKRVVSDLPWTADVTNLVKGRRLAHFTKDAASGCIAVTRWFDEAVGKELVDCWRSTGGASAAAAKVEELRHSARVLISEEEEAALSFLGRRIRGEIFFARRWILVEGVADYLLLHAIARALDVECDRRGVSVIDFQNNGNAAIYPALADGFGIPWDMVLDGDDESKRFQRQLLKRGFSATDLAKHVATLTPPNDLEGQLLADGHEALLREVLKELGIMHADTCSVDDLRKLLKHRKTAYMTALAPRVAADQALAVKMPNQFLAVL